MTSLAPVWVQVVMAGCLVVGVALVLDPPLRQWLDRFRGTPPGLALDGEPLSVQPKVPMKVLACGGLLAAL